MVPETAFDLVPDSQRLLVPVYGDEHDSLVQKNSGNRIDNSRHVTFPEAIQRPVAGRERLFRPVQFEQVGAPVLEAACDQRDPLRHIAGPEAVFDLLPDRERLFVTTRLFEQRPPVRLGIRNHGKYPGPVVALEALPPRCPKAATLPPDLPALCSAAALFISALHIRFCRLRRTLPPRSP